MKEIGIYDKLCRPLLNHVIEYLESQGFSRQDALYLYEAETSDIIIINPQSVGMVDEWNEISDFIKNNPQKKMIITTPDLGRDEVEKIIGGTYEHVSIIDKEDIRNRELSYSDKIIKMVLADMN